MAEVDPVILEIRAQMGRYNAELRSSTALAQQSFGRQEKSVLSLERQVASSTANMQRLLSGARSMFAGAFAGVGILAAAKEMLGYVDAFKQYEAQLRLATAQTGSFNQAQADVQRIAAETRTGIAETASLYATFQRNARELGITQEQAARATETVSKSFAISGASAAEAAGGLRQFLQGVQSGTLRGEELNSVLENAPRLARLLADSLGITIGQLRALGQEGQLAGDKLITALTDRKFTAAIDEEFQQLPVTFDQAMTQVYNAATLTFGAFDRGGEFSAALTSFITGGTSGMQDLASSAENAGADIRAAFGALGDVFEPLWEGAKGVFDRIDIRIQSTRDAIADLLGLYDSVNNLFIGLDRFGAQVDNALKRGGVMMGQQRELPEWSNTRGTFLDSYDRRRGQIQQRQNARRAADAAQDAARRDQPAPRRTPTPAAASRRRAARGPSAETLARRAEQERLRQIREDQAFADEKAQLDQDLIRAKAASVTAAEALAGYERQEIEFARSRQNSAYQADVAMKRLTQAQADELIAKNDAVAAERQRAVDVREARRLAAEAVEAETNGLRNRQELLSEQIGLADTLAVRRRLELQLLELQRQEEEARLRAVLAVNSGADAAERRTAQARLDALPGIYGARRAGVERANESPNQRYSRSFRDPATQVEEAIVQRLDQVDDAITDAINKRLGVKDPLIQSLLDILIQQVLLKPIADALAGVKGGKNSWVNDAVSFVGSLFGRSSGGYVPPNSVRRVNEGSGGVELLRMGPQGGTVIPLGQARAAPRGGGNAASSRPPIVFDMRGAVVTEDLLQQMQALARDESITVVRGAAPAIVDAATSKTVATLGRPRI